jgi:hypothetical protein
MGRSDRFVHGVAPDAENREKDDFYPTPIEATKSLMALEDFPPTIWEPACGDGAISKVFMEQDFDVVSSDLVDRGFGEPNIDFLMERSLPRDAFGEPVKCIVTNPPFKLAEQFVEHALNLGAEKVCMLLRLAWLEGVSRKALFRRTNLSRIWVSSRRLTMVRAGDETLRGNGGMVAFAWFVWENGPPFPATLFFFDWMEHAPECAQQRQAAAPEPMPLFAE